MTRKFRPLRGSAGYSEKARADYSAKSRKQTRKSSTTGSPASVMSPQSSDRTLLQTQPVVVSTLPLENAGFLGPTSYRSLLREGDSGTADPSFTAHTIEPRQLDLGLQAVAFLVSEAPLLGNLVKYTYDIGRTPIIPGVLMLPALDCLWEILGDYASVEEASRLRTVVHIFENSYHPIPVNDDMKADDISQLISGKNLRWETISIVLTISTLALMYMPSHVVLQVDSQKRTKDELLAQILEVTEKLSTISNALPAVNELLVCWKYYQMVLASQRFGDSRKHPGFIHQWRRLCFTGVYAMDKAIATTLGRPPLMNRYYCVLEPPLDLDYGIDPRQYESNLQLIDSNGWNTDIRWRPTTLFRLRFLLATVREEILELHLGVTGSDAVGRADGLLHRLRSIWEACPNQVKYSPDMWSGPHRCNDTLVLLSVYLDYLHSTFLLHRFTAQGMPGGKSQALCLVAKNILSTILFLPYGLPSAQLLSMELLHRSTSLSIPTTLPFPRAEVIRELTLFVSCLSWVSRPGNCNFGYCNQIKAKLTRTLDQILDPSFAAPSLYNHEVDAGRPVIEGFAEGLDSGLSLSTLLDSGIENQWNFGLDLFSGSVF
ncbi:hypothetical protein BO70DRAFT_400397 [Aspergillus heteromorphus CBS 117.55]|uniref:Transcription factor domain-containing protein n=1 Tax=Aspergillus heteromorphus CBS 117.55 TaxID=1448321 RepID=A0A317V8T9_9EURO|nr:uncharacterized protein BO70DRAFT_400397 [Aspergillus heteromorphus CBS 117.55]PWY68480.1 hypothetical protein BO70DRAFT_400397 [Aspergillus heteromorphus CBS 117.55]